MLLFALAFYAAFAASAQVQSPATLDDVEVSTDEVVFVLDRPVKEKIQRLEKPERLVVEFPGTFSALAQGVFEGQGRFLALVRAAQSEAAAGTARLIVELKASAVHQAQWEGGRLSVRFLEPARPKAIPKGAQDAAAAAAQPMRPNTIPKGPQDAAAAQPMRPNTIPKGPQDAAAAQPALKPAAPKKAAGRGFLVQAGAFSKKETALSFKQEIEPAVPGWIVSTVTVKSAVLYRLRAGPFATRAEAESAVKKLAAMGEKAVVLPAP